MGKGLRHDDTGTLWEVKVTLRSGGCERSVFGNGVEGLGLSPKAAGEEHNQFCISQDNSVVWLRKQIEK